jgi:hypothetical protein
VHREAFLAISKRSVTDLPLKTLQSLIAWGPWHVGHFNVLDIV